MRDERREMRDERREMTTNQKSQALVIAEYASTNIEREWTPNSALGFLIKRLNCLATAGELLRTK